MNRDDAYLRHIVDAVGKIELFIGQMSQEEFKMDLKTQSAVILQLMLIGEMVKRVSAETRQLVPLPWKEFSGFRDRAIHNYYEIDLDIIWSAVIEDIPFIKEKLLRSRTQ